jgi:hypothetical protein
VWLHPDVIEAPISGPDELTLLVSRMIGGISVLEVVLAFAAFVPTASEPDNSRYLHDLAAHMAGDATLTDPAPRIGSGLSISKATPPRRSTGPGWRALTGPVAVCR